jgi:hypothetical protein
MSSVGLADWDIDFTQWGAGPSGSGFSLSIPWAPVFSATAVPQIEVFSGSLGQTTGVLGGPGSVDLGQSASASAVQVTPLPGGIATQSTHVEGTQETSISGGPTAGGSAGATINIGVWQIQLW